MFFALSKIVALFVSPFFWIALFLLIAYFKKSRRFLLLAVASVFFFGNNFIADEACRAWEVSVNPKSLKPHYDYAIVLGGMSDYQPAYRRLQFNGASDRLWQTLLLQNQGKIDSIIITGGSGKWDKPNEHEAARLNEFLSVLLPKNKSIIFESKSRNTAQNAQFTLAKFPQIRNKKLLIITSGFHARRALACFSKVGLQADIYTVDMMGGERKYAPDHTIVPSVTAIRTWAFLIKEWIGCIAYQIKGYI